MWGGLPRDRSDVGGSTRRLLSHRSCARVCVRQLCQPSLERGRPCTPWRLGSAKATRLVMGDHVPRARSQKGTGSIKAGQFAALSLCNVVSLEAQFRGGPRALLPPLPPRSSHADRLGDSKP
ncbi:hypothetical protein HPB50_027412 [Hyalomma asiaticum]|uniref:Uncharacterized protein n=1 Tax=Hyalomma asiaticum TaxID=266040 RepID=A0ACB7T9E3_HYAAI|nr:hypothetical protein HPB50_027412 [Hyalomma asiaticum]